MDGMILKPQETGSWKSDLLQRSYGDFENLLGFSEKQTREALIRLEKRNILMDFSSDCIFAATVLCASSSNFSANRMRNWDLFWDSTPWDKSCVY